LFTPSTSTRTASGLSICMQDFRIEIFWLVQERYVRISRSWSLKIRWRLKNTSVFEIFLHFCSLNCLKIKDSLFWILIYIWNCDQF
jgi:hypothetical protein